MTEKRFMIFIDSNDRKSLWDDERTEEEPLISLNRFGEIYGIDDCCKLLNRLAEENEQLKQQNKELKQNNDIKFWKHQCINESNANSVIMHELGKVIDEGYKVSDKFKEFMGDLKKSAEENKKKIERLDLND